MKEPTVRRLLAGAVASILIMLLLSLRVEAPVARRTAALPPPAQPVPQQLASAQPLHAPQHAALPPGIREAYIVQAASATEARSAVMRAGGQVTGDLSVIRAVSALLDDRELEALEAADVAGLNVYPDSKVTASSTSGKLPETWYPSEVAANNLQVGGVTGIGVTVAVVDSGLWNQEGPDQSAPGQAASRVLAQYDVASNTTNVNDSYGHGTHITSIIASSGVASTGNFQGVAPGVNLVAVRVLDSTGKGSYSNVIKGIQWVLQNRWRYNIRVMNLSLSAPPQSFYWQDPLNQAVMSAWSQGIVVVVAAGNAGPKPMTIGVPGNVPYVITVGAVTDSYHPMQVSQYKLTSFSSTGPTYEGFVKPEVVGMGGHILAYAPNNGTLAQEFPQWVTLPYDDFTMSGTSMATAVTSGVVALMLEVSPSLSPDTVKCRLMSGAHPAVKSDGTLAYTVFQQGAGLVNAHDAVYSTASGCANQGLNVLYDLSGFRHYGGRANQDPSTGDYYIMATTGGSGGGLLGGVVSLLGNLLWGVIQLGDGLLWNGTYSSSNVYNWSGGYTWSNGYTWSSGYPWSSGTTQSAGYTGGGIVVPAQQ